MTADRWCEAGSRPRFVSLAAACLLASSVMVGAGAGPTDAAEPGGLGPAVLDTGRLISSGEARRLASQCGVIPVVLGSRSEVLDLGRTVRLHTPAQRIALRIKHTACTVEGCSVPAAWCHAHHKTPWSRGGKTSVTDGTLLCGRHHRAVHLPGNHATYRDDGTTVITRTTRRRQ